MEDFRKKIKNYKATPNDLSWERMLIKKEKQKFRIVKMAVLTLLAINLIGISTMLYKNLNKPTITSINEVLVESNDNKKELKELEYKYNEQISTLTTKNTKLRNQITNLQLNLESVKLGHQKSKYSISQMEKTISNFQYTQSQSDLSKNIKTTPLATNDIVITKAKPTFDFLPRLANRNNSIEKYLLDLNSQNAPTFPFILNNIIVESEPLRNWYVSVGTSYENLVQDRQRNLSLGLYRSVHKRFDIGLRFSSLNKRERSEFRINNDVKDQITENQSLLLVRFYAYKTNNLSFHLDTGIGYRFGNIINRRGTVIENQLQYHNEAIKFNGLAYQLAIGAMYGITKQFSVGTRFYLDQNLHSNLNLIYKF